ncbi:pilus assembly FimT family protein [Desulfothermobacter acidiphilus]|uniref:pilus assembly FimT family protein n=1 Tax=Desulfothermobacter acidiphilus TaxID=1938353 RepID=UPI003F88C51F
MVRFAARVLKRREAGFSLLELVVVLAISAIMVSGLFLAWQRCLSHQVLQTSSVELLQEARLAQEQALSTGEIWEVRFYRKGKAHFYGIWREGESEPWREKELPQSVVIHAASFRRQGNYRYVRFAGRSTTFDAGTLVLRSGKAYRFLVVSSKGRIRLDTKPPDGWPESSEEWQRRWPL